MGGLRVHLADLGLSPSATAGMRMLAAGDRHRAHVLTADPAAADIILFSDLHLLPHDLSLRALRRHPLLVSYPEKCFVYDERDTPWLSLPGLYVSMPAPRFDDGCQVACAYYSVPRAAVDADVEPHLLFSFMGARTHPIRARVLELRHDRADIADTSGFVFFQAPADDPRRRRFADLLAASKFVLCPRGAGTSSIRLFETLAAGRVPVIVSDDWVPPRGVEWDDISVRIPESDVAQIPALLQEREADYSQLAARTRDTYDRLFAPDTAWNSLIESVVPLLARRPAGTFQGSWHDGQRLRAEATYLRSRAHGRAAKALHAITRCGCL